MALSIIGAGFGRTGTDSLKNALEMLGVGNCYHMHEVIPDQARVDSWRAVATGKSPDWDSIFHGYGATVDWPAAFYWRELSEYYPEAKVLLSVRDADLWYDSIEKTILTSLRKSTDPASLGLTLIRDQVFGGNIDDRKHVIAAYNKNTADVQASIPPERLLTYHTGDGWGPICEFLDIPIPTEPYPHRNQAGSFHDKLEALNKVRDAGKS
ncbi:MAG: sulfotransferase family protein [Sneathiella sp.]